MTQILFANLLSGVSTDCPSLINFAQGLHMNSKQPAIWSAIQTNCCVTANTRVNCDASERIYQINWPSLQLDGVIDEASLSTLTFLYYLILNDNFITGNIPSVLPLSLETLYVHGNLMSGDLPAFPPTLKNLAIGFQLSPPGNKFTGTLRLNRPTEMQITNNLISDIIIQDYGGLTSRSNTIYCDISNTPLLGNPNIVQLTVSICKQTGLYAKSTTLTTKSTTKLQSGSSSTSTSSTHKSLSKTSYTMSTTIKIVVKTLLKSSLFYASSVNTGKMSTSAEITILTTTMSMAESDYNTLNSNNETPKPTTIFQNSLILGINQRISSSSVSIIDFSESNFNTVEAPTSGPILGLSSFSSVVTSTTVTLDAGESTAQDATILYVLLGAFVNLIVLVIVASKIIKNPKIKNSRFGRKNSFGTLNTVSTNVTTLTK